MHRDGQDRNGWRLVGCVDLRHLYANRWRRTQIESTREELACHLGDIGAGGTHLDHVGDLCGIENTLVHLAVRGGLEDGAQALVARQYVSHRRR